MAVGYRRCDDLCMGQSKTCIKLLTSSIPRITKKSQLNEDDILDDNNNSKCVTASVKTVKKCEKEFHIPILYTKSIVNKFWYKICTNVAIYRSSHKLYFDKDFYKQKIKVGILGLKKWLYQRGSHS